MTPTDVLSESNAAYSSRDLQAERAVQPQEETTIDSAIFLPNWVGDVTMATPALRALRQQLGRGGRLIGVARPYVRQVLAGTAWLDDLIDYDAHAADARLHPRAVIERLRMLRPQRAVLLTNSLRSAWIAWRAAIPARIGYVRYGRGPLLTHRLLPPRRRWRLTPVSAVDYYLRLTEAAGAPGIDRSLELATTEADEQAAEACLHRWQIAPSDFLVALNGGAAYGSAKNWPTESFAGLAQRLIDHHGCKVVITCGPAEHAAAVEIVRQADRPHIASPTLDELGLGLTKALIKRSRLLISTDSGPRHFGAAFGVPTVTLFGPTDPRWSHNYHPQSIELQRQLPCGPCARRQCPLKHHRCMRELSIDQVHRAAQRWLPTIVRRDAA